jgi:hypothetical protein
MRPLLVTFLFTITFSGVFATQWLQRTSIPAVGRHRATAVGLGSKGYVGMGHINGTGTETYFADWWEFDPATNSWSQKANYPGFNGVGDLGLHTWTYDSKAYVGLGENDHYALYRYDPSINSWQQMTSAPASNNFQDTQEMITDTKVFFTDLWGDELWEYDCPTDSWSLRGPLPFAWYFSYSGFTYNDECWVKADMLMWKYTPSTNTWQQVVGAGVYPGYAVRASNSFFVDDKFYIANGYGQGGTGDVTSEVWEFDPATLQWSQQENFSGTSRRYSKTFIINDVAYITTGTNGTNQNDLWEFNKYLSLDKNKTISVAAFPNPTTDIVTFNDFENNSFEIQILNLQGQIIEQAKTLDGSIVFDLERYDTGQYIYRQLINGKLAASDKLLVL